MSKEQDVENLLSVIREELLTRDKFSIEAVVHSRDLDFDSLPIPGENQSGALILYLDSSNKQRLFKDIGDILPLQRYVIKSETDEEYNTTYLKEEENAAGDWVKYSDFQKMLLEK